MRAPRRTLGPVLAAAVGASAYGLLLVGTAQGATCAQVSISPGVQAPTLTPAKATIDAGGCAAYTNNTAFAVNVTVGKVSGVANPNGVVTFLEKLPGTFAVTAQEQFQGQALGGKGSGTLVVRKPPAPAPSPSQTSPAPRPSPSASHPQPSATPTSSGPVVASSPPTHAPSSSPSATPAPNQSGQGNPPVIGGIPTASPTPSPSDAVVGARLQPPSGRAAGLPAAIAALLVVGAAGAFFRVLLAEPVAGVPRAS
ncbi:MAG: hypothetical protein JO079_13380 [Frankiaceae bacterium]|nr:hypothetical protein [Frankiaceae bacterium]